MTDEHVLPRTIGGNLHPYNPFLLKNVCRSCNSAAGRHIDGPFIRSWFIQNQRSLNARKYLDLASDPIIPLVFQGELQTPLLTDKTCDLWQGPTGDPIYHFHDSYPEAKDAEPSIGPPPYLSADEIDPGFAFLFIRASNPCWHKSIILSFAEHFEESILYLGNSPTIPGGRFSDIPNELVELCDRLKAMIGQKWQQIRFSVAADFGHRFLAKLALGCGALFLDSAFLQSPDAARLRNFMWERNPDARADMQIPGITFLSQKLGPAKQLIGWPAGHVILLLPVDGRLLLSPFLYGELSAAIEISSDPSMWSGRIDDDGTVFVIAPGFGKFVGPISLADYIGTRTETTTTSNPLSQLFSIVQSIGPLPPYDLTN